MTPTRHVDGLAVVRSGNVSPSPFLASTMGRLGAMSGWHGGRRCCLDVGCGNGRNSRYMSGLGFEVVALDWSPEYGVKYDLRQRRLPLFSGTADVVLLNYVLMFLPGDERDAIVMEASRLMGPMGVAVVEFFHAKGSFCPTRPESVAACAEAARLFESSGKLVYLRSPERFVASSSRLPLAPGRAGDKARKACQGAREGMTP